MSEIKHNVSTLMDDRSWADSANVFSYVSRLTLLLPLNFNFTWKYFSCKYI